MSTTTIMNSTNKVCIFQSCNEPSAFNSMKCLFHRHRSQCTYYMCSNQVYARGLCVRHGGKTKCEVPNCTMNTRVGNFCAKHCDPLVKRYCDELNCSNQAHGRGKCVRHGGGRRCLAELCTLRAKYGPYCKHHSGSDDSVVCLDRGNTKTQ